ncbi:MAG: RluA family pseudouridine synthase [Deltaproteobacteria bacterium]|nr:RluA family pseudouridine synthase [Deltaproteobacteria bacterium]
MMEIQIRHDEAELRPDRLLRKRFPDVTRDNALAYLKTGKFLLDGAQVRLATRVQAGQLLTLDVSQSKLGIPADASLDVIAHTPHFVVVNKESGVAMHTGTGVEDESVTLKGAIAALFPMDESDDDKRHHHGRAFRGPSFLGRLDRLTSGLVIAALTWEGLQSIEPAWTDGDVEKAYLLLVHGRAPDEKHIEVPLVSLRERHKGKGRVEEARTDIHTLGTAPDGRISLVLAFLHTGRTHQIRRHLKAIGHPLVADPRYGHKKKDESLRRQNRDPGTLQLHCFRYRFSTSVGDLPLTLQTPIPERMRRLMQEVGIDLSVVQAAAELTRAPLHETS